MKLLLSFLFLSLIFNPASFAAETLSVPAADAGSARADYQNAFQAIVTGDGQLRVKPGQVFSEGTDTASIQLPYLVSHSKAIQYPRWALRQGRQGEVVLAVEILPSGAVGRYAVMHSSNYKSLDEAAVNAVKSWKFHPAMKNGQAVLTCIQIPISFQIAEEKS